MKKYIFLTISTALLTAFTLKAQEPPAPGSGEPKEHYIRSQVDGMMVKDIELITDFYSENIELYKYPNSVLAKGKGAAKEYWTNQFTDKTEMDYQMINHYEVGQKVIALVKKRNPELNEDSNIGFIIELKDSKIQRVFIIE